MLAEIDTMEILTRVEQYYNNAYSNLITVLTVVLTVGLVVVGIVIPLLLAWQQQRSFKSTKKNILAEAKQHIDAETELYKDNLRQLIKQSVQQVHHHSAIHWYEMAEATLKTDARTLALKYWCFAINSALQADWPPTERKWKWLLNCLGEFQEYGSTKDIAKMPEIRDPIIETISYLRQMPETEPYTILLAKLENLLSPKKSQS